MRTGRYYAQSDFYYSALYGSGIYEWNGQTVQDPLGGDRGEDCVSPLLTNTITGETFFMERFSAAAQAHCQRLILAPPRGGHILWPRDMMCLEPEQQESCHIFVAHEYMPNPRPEAEREGGCALLFAYGGYPRMVDGQRKLSQIDTPTWKTKEVRDMAVEIARALENLNRSGYYDTDIHLSRMYFMDDGQVYLDFSNLIFSFQELAEEAEACRVKTGEYPVEFADPALVRGLVPCADIHSQNYSMCALFFYLFMGRYPYDGRLLTGCADDTPQQHYIKFREYHKMPVFIFDPKDTNNRLGAFWEEQQAIELWEELPGCLREMFIQTLQQNNAERTKKVNNPAPGAWLQCFRELGWYDKNKKTEGTVNE